MEGSLCILVWFLFQIAQDTFVALGRRLKARRTYDELDILESYVPVEKQDEPDPADQDDELKKVLLESVKKGEDKMDKVSFTRHLKIWHT